MVHQHSSNRLPMRNRQQGSIKRNLVILLFIVIGVLMFTASMLPQSYSADTSQIGKGKPAIVIIYDGENGVSHELMESFSKVRGDFEPKVLFILADIEAPDGRAFAKANAMSTAVVLFFDGEGNRITAIYSPQEADTLKESIQRIFAF